MTRPRGYTPGLVYDQNISDPEQVGGAPGVVHHDGNGNDTYTSAPNSDELARYRNMGELAAQRKAYQVDFSQADQDQSNSLGARAQQLQAADQMRLAAMGGAPSRAAIMGNQAAGQSLESTLGASAGARGMGAAAAQSQAMRGQGAMQQQAVGQYVGMRASELGDARSQYAGLANQIRGGDYATQAQDQAQAEAQAQAEMAQRQLNQSAQMGYEQMGINHEQAQSDDLLRRGAINAQVKANGDAQHDATVARNMKVAQAGVTAVGTLAGSDERIKENISPLHESAPQAGGKGDMGQALAKGLAPYEYEYKPGFRGAEGQTSGEKNVGPMAQNMASNPVTGTAVKQGPNGMLYIDQPKALKVSLGGIGYLAAEQQRMKAELARMKGGGNGSR